MATNSNFWADIMIKFNKEFFYRWSTWQNVLECVGAVGLQLLTNLPPSLSGPMWVYVGLRVAMAVVQGVKQSASES